MNVIADFRQALWGLALFLPLAACGLTYEEAYSSCLQLNASDQVVQDCARLKLEMQRSRSERVQAFGASLQTLGIQQQQLEQRQHVRPPVHCQTYAGGRYTTCY